MPASHLCTRNITVIKVAIINFPFTRAGQHFHSNKKQRKNVISSPVALTFSRESRGWNRNDGIPRSIAATRSFDFGMLITHNRRLAPPRNSAEFLYSASISVTISRPGLPSLLVLVFRGAFRVYFEAFEFWDWNPDTISRTS